MSPGPRWTFPEPPCLVVGSVTHTRLSPRRRAFRTAQYQWLVDLDRLPRLAPPFGALSRFEARDHLDAGRRGGGIKGDLLRFLQRRGVEVEPADRVLMLAHARVFGHVFDPLTVFWCLGPGDTLKAVVLEVHNTYGERHAYLIHPDEAGRARVDKRFYVSPFNDTRGVYEVVLRVDPQRLTTAIGLDRDGERVFGAAATGSVVPATRSRVLAVAARHAFMTQRVSLLIRLHGLRLWLSRLRVRPRPIHSEETVR